MYVKMQILIFCTTLTENPLLIASTQVEKISLIKIPSKREHKKQLDMRCIEGGRGANAHGLIGILAQKKGLGVISFRACPPFAQGDKTDKNFNILYVNLC